MTKYCFSGQSLETAHMVSQISKVHIGKDVGKHPGYYGQLTSIR